MNSKKRRRKSAFSQESADSDFQSSSKDNSNPGNNGQSSNSLTNLLEQYNSDSDDQDDTPPENKHRLDDKVNDFFKEIQFITQNTQESQSNDSSKKDSTQTSSSKERVSASPWQECFDESTGYPYYWHIETNEVTWELPKELASTRKNSDNIVPQHQLQHQPNRLPKLPYDKLPSKAKNDLSARNKSRHKSGTGTDTGSSKRALPKKKSKQTFEDKNDDSDDSYIEMITSFGDDNTDTDKSDDEKTADESWTLNKSIKREREREALESRVSNDTRDEENSKESNRESIINNLTVDQSNEENSFSKKPAATLFPAAVTKSWFVDGNPKVDTTVDQEFSQASDSQDTDKIEPPKLSRPLENLGTSLKGFQRKRRIAYDVLTIPKNNEDRLGLGFAKTPPIENSSKETAEERKRNLGKYAIDFIKGETLETNEATPDYFMPADQVQMIADKLKSLSKECSTVSEIQVMSIQIQVLMTAWESGDLKDRYFYNWMAETKKELTLLEEKAAPAEWDYQWDSANKQYFYRNKISGETQVNYPDINGGAEEMELCTTPPPANSPISEIKSIEIIKDDMTQTKSLSNDNINRVNVNSHTDLEKSDKSSSSASLAGDPDNNKEDGELAAPLPPRISIPSPPPPPRIGAQDLKKNSKINKSNNDCLNSGTVEQAEVKNHIIVESIVAPVRETLLTPATQILAASVNPQHIEPLPPGVDQSESPYALAAATLKSPLIFPGNHHQPNATIFDPTNISILGHHHPALVHNQLVHYPVYHQHLHDQAILAAANRFTGQEAVQLMLHHTGIYANTQVITKPPINMKKESLGSIVDSFYNDIASLECHNNVINDKQIKQVAVPSMKYQESVDKTESISTNISTTITTAATTTGTGSAPSVSVPVATAANSTASTTTTNSGGVTTINNATANAPVDLKDKKKKKVKIVINKKHKQVSSMVAKWKKAQNFEDIH